MNNFYTKNKFGTYVPNEATQAYKNFYNDLTANELFVSFLYLAEPYIEEHLDEITNDYAEIIYDENNPYSSKVIKYFKSDEGKKLFSVHAYEQYLGQMHLARIIDNFTMYLKEILSEVVLNKLDVLKSKDQERLDFILSFESLDELKIAIAEKKVEELFYKGIADIEKFFLDRLGIKLFEDEETRRALTCLIKQRNLIVHNRGRVNKEFSNVFNEYSVGSLLEYSAEEISEIYCELNNFIVFLDKEISLKFKLLTSQISGS